MPPGDFQVACLSYLVTRELSLLQILQWAAGSAQQPLALLLERKSPVVFRLLSLLYSQATELSGYRSLTSGWVAQREFMTQVQTVCKGNFPFLWICCMYKGWEPGGSASVSGQEIREVCSVSLFAPGSTQAWGAHLHLTISKPPHPPSTIKLSISWPRLALDSPSGFLMLSLHKCICQYFWQVPHAGLGRDTPRVSISEF